MRGHRITPTLSDWLLGALLAVLGLVALGQLDTYYRTEAETAAHQAAAERARVVAQASLPASGQQAGSLRYREARP